VEIAAILATNTSVEPPLLTCAALAIGKSVEDVDPMT
jgi:hypothetical protein